MQDDKSLSTKERSRRAKLRSRFGGVGGIASLQPASEFHR